MNSSVKTTTVFQITGGVITKMTAVIIQMKKIVVNNSCLKYLEATSLFNKQDSNF